MIKAVLVDPRRGNTARINGEGELNVVVHPHPPKEEDVTARPFVSRFFNSGSDDLRVDGSSESIDFTVTSDPELDIYVKTISVIIADSGATLSKYGNLSELVNGTQIIWKNVW